jgi:hypothetical protein
MDDGTRSDTMQILDMATRLTVQYLQNLAINNSQWEIPHGFLEAQVESMVKRLTQHHATISQYLQSPSNQVSTTPSGEMRDG